MLCVMFSLSSYICIVAYHLGTLDAQRVDVDHVLTEPNHKTVLGGRVLKSEGRDFFKGVGSVTP